MQSPTFETETAPRISIRAEAVINHAYLRVIHSGRQAQVAVMTLPPDGDTGPRILAGTDQLFVVVTGAGEAKVGPRELGVVPGDLVFVGADTPHTIINRTVAPMQLIVVLAPPVFPAGTVIETRPEPLA